MGRVAFHVRMDGIRIGRDYSQYRMADWRWQVVRGRLKRQQRGTADAA